MGNAEDAVACFKEGYNCSQAVLAAYAESFGLDRRTALRLSSAFGGGIARTGGTCGAVTGALMVIGLHCGKKGEPPFEGKNDACAMGGKFLKEFRARHDSVQCRELLRCDVGKEEGMEHAKKENLFALLCPKFVESAAQILDEMLRGESSD